MSEEPFLDPKIATPKFWQRFTKPWRWKNAPRDIIFELLVAITVTWAIHQLIEWSLPGPWIRQLTASAVIAIFVVITEQGWKNIIREAWMSDNWDAIRALTEVSFIVPPNMIYQLDELITHAKGKDWDPEEILEITNELIKSDRSRWEAAKELSGMGAGVTAEVLSQLNIYEKISRENPRDNPDPEELLRSVIDMLKYAKRGNYPRAVGLWLKVGVKSLDLPIEVRKEVTNFLDRLEINGLYTKQVFTERMHATLAALGNLAKGERFDSNVYEQFQIATSLARVFGSNNLIKTVYATTFDPPTDFYHVFGGAYFKVQENFKIAEDSIKRFSDITAPEVKMLRTLCDSGVTSEMASSYARGEECPDKARIVVRSLRELLIDFRSMATQEAREGFEQFNRWHMENFVGLRYHIIDTNIFQKYMMDDFEAAAMGHNVIVDFIVYNENVVFGRTNAMPESLAATLHLLHDHGHEETGVIAPIRHYKNYFEKVLWPRARPLCELWIWLATEHSADFGPDLGSMKRIAEAVVRAAKPI